MSDCTELRTITGRTIEMPVSFRLPVRDYAELCERAKADGVCLSAWLRRSVGEMLQSKAANHDRWD